MQLTEEQIKSLRLQAQAIQQARRETFLPDAAAERNWDLEQQGYKVFIIRTELEYVVVAKDEKEATKYGPEAMRDDCVSESDFEAISASYLPAPYDDPDLVYCPDELGDMTVKQAMYLPGGYNHGQKIEVKQQDKEEK